MLPFTILIHNTNAIPSSPSTDISLTHFLQSHFQYPFQSSFHRYARIPSLISNIFLWLAFIFAIIVLHIGKDDLSTGIRIIYGLIMLFIIIICYIFILFESKGCTEQILLKKRIQIDMIKRELGLIQNQSKLTKYLTITATNYYNSFTRKYIDYQLYNKSLCVRLQSFFYRNIHLIETPFHTREYYINIPDFSLIENRLCEILFDLNLSIIGRDADIVYEDMEDEFQRLEMKFLNTMDEFHSIKKFAQIKRYIHFQFDDFKQQDLLFGQRRTCLVYENQTKISYRWFLTENIFWIMTCIGLSWLFRAIFACLITKIIVPTQIELEGAMPLQSNISLQEKISDQI